MPLKNVAGVVVLTTSNLPCWIGRGVMTEAVVVIVVAVIADASCAIWLDILSVGRCLIGRERGGSCSRLLSKRPEYYRRGQFR